MVEAGYWATLEYRVCRELAGMPDRQLQSLWCDGFIPDQYLLDDNKPRVIGRAWICKGRQQDEWEFTLILPRSVGSRDAIDWASLLPPENVTHWLYLDRKGKRIEIEPAAAIPDRAEPSR
jgi:hypothetical protein